MRRSGRSRLLRRGSPRLVAACTLTLALAGCGAATTGGNRAITIRGKTLTVFLSQPPGGALSEPARDVLAAEQLAFSQSGGRVGAFTVRLRVLSGAKLSDNARKAIEDQSAIAYLGELVPGTSEVSVEIANQQGLLEVSPADTAVYLTQAIPPVSDSPQTFYPGHATYGETFARVVPNSGAEAKALVNEMQAEHVTSVYLADDGQRYGAALALEVRATAKTAGLSIASAARGAGAVFYGATLASASERARASRFLDGAAAADPSAPLFVPSGLYDASFVASLSAAAQQRLIASSPGFEHKDLPPAGQSFAAAFAAAEHHAPAPQAIFGYEAMKSVLTVLAQVGPNAGNRAVVVAAFRALKDRSSAIGTYSINGGDPSIAPFVLARVRGGTLVPFRSGQLAG